MQIFPTWLMNLKNFVEQLSRVSSNTECARDCGLLHFVHTFKSDQNDEKVTQIKVHTL